ncbi:MAG: helix-turn-helix domain-containing protein [Fimbriimonadaceae bacterium]|nr:helix-turn-helix domain-containing protein [Chitinophagales bacterium]
MIKINPLNECVELQEPRRIMKYVLVWCSYGSVSIVVDENEFEIKANEVITITSGQIHYFKKIKDPAGFILEFTYDFFCKNDNDIELIFHNGLFCHFDENEIITFDNIEMVQKELEQIKTELNKKPYQYLISIHSRIELILVEINRSKIKLGNDIWKPDALFLKFLELVRANFQYNYQLSYFANVLGTTEAKLNDHSKLHTGKTAQNVIYGLIVSEAKRLLTYQNLSIKEVSHQLGFNDPFYFSNFFKKHTSQSPKSYKTKLVL